MFADFGSHILLYFAMMEKPCTRRIIFSLSLFQKIFTYTRQIQISVSALSELNKDKFLEIPITGSQLSNHTVMLCTYLHS